MAITHQTVRRAFSLLKEQGISAVLKKTAAKYLGLGAKTVDESKIVFDLLSREKKPGVMIDVGAHCGAALAPFARAGWQVFAFEPDAENRTKLEQAFMARSNVHIDARAISDQAKHKATFYRSSVSTGISGLSAFHPTHVATGEVEITTLDVFCGERQIQAVDFLKIDVEGFDLPVLRGFPWDRLAPRVILCEFEDAKTVGLGYSFQDLARFLEARRYRLIVSEWYPIKAYGGFHQWRRFAPYPCELKDSHGWGNIIAASADDVFDNLLTIARRYKPLDR